jgi:hypothetical protein
MDMNKHGLHSPGGFDMVPNIHSVPKIPDDNNVAAAMPNNAPTTTLPQISTNLDLIGVKKPIDGDKAGQSNTHVNSNGT